MKSNKYLLSCFTAFLVFFSNCLLAENKIDFWNGQKKGANFFNKTPTEEWFRDASNLGVEWVRMAYEKWKSAERDFLVGDHGNYQSLVRKDLEKLLTVLDYAHKYKIKVVIVPLGLPGNRWSQLNGGKKDLRLWNEELYWESASKFWKDLAGELKNHPAIIGYNLLNEPVPELNTGLQENGSVKQNKEWYEKYKDTNRDLPMFYEKVIAEIRKVDLVTPIMLDSGWYANPGAFAYWRKIDDPFVLYSVHMYEPYAYTSRHNFHGKKN